MNYLKQAFMFHSVLLCVYVALLWWLSGRFWQSYSAAGGVFWLLFIVPVVLAIRGTWHNLVSTVALYLGADHE